MKYISDDGKVFNTERECSEYEQCLENQRVKKEQFEKERQKRLGDINKKYEELQNLISEYEKDYGLMREIFSLPFCEILDMLCG